MSAESLGIDIGGTNTLVGLVDSQGRILAKKSILTDNQKRPLEVVEEIVEKSEHIIKGHKVSQVGVGIAGLVDHEKGVVRFSPNLKKWRKVPLKDMLAEHFRVPVAVGNDVNVIAWGEYRFGGYGTEDLFCFTLGTGVGGGIVSGGRLIWGANHAAGEFGHTSFVQDGRLCTCGLRGCLEAYVASDYLVKKAKKRMRLASPLMSLARNRKLTPRLITRAAREGDQVAISIFTDAGKRIGRALGNVVQLLDPEVIVVNGGISNAGNLLLEPIRESLRSYTMPLPGRRLRVVRSRLGEKAGILGAAALAEILK